MEDKADHISFARDPPWYSDASVLFRRDRLREFWPHPMHTSAERLNAVVRFCAYAGLVSYLARRRAKYLVLALAAAALATLLYGRRSGDVESELRMPTLANPFSNTLAGSTWQDDGKVSLAASACDLEDASIEAMRSEFFKKDLFMNFEDAWNKRSSERNFITVPEHDTMAFARFCFKDMPGKGHAPWGTAAGCKTHF